MTNQKSGTSEKAREYYLKWKNSPAYKAYLERSKERRKQQQDQYRKTPKGIARAKQYAKENSERQKLYMRSWRRKQMKLPPHVSPPPQCESCKKPIMYEGNRNDMPNLDHDHKTGEFRGWLCGGCNRAFGLLGDSIDGVQNLLDYAIFAKQRMADKRLIE